MWTNRNPRWINKNGIDESIPISTSIHSGMRKSSTPDYSDSNGTRGNGNRIPIGTTDPTCGINVSPNIVNTRQSTTPNLRKSNKLDTSIDWQFTNNMVVPPIFTELLCDKLSDCSIQNLYIRVWINLTADPINIPAPQFLDFWLSTSDVLYKGASIWNPLTRVGSPAYVAHWSAPDHTFENYSGWRHCEHKFRI